MKTIILIGLLSLSSCLSKPTDPEKNLVLHPTEGNSPVVKAAETAVHTTSDDHAIIPLVTADKAVPATNLTSPPNSIPTQTDKKDPKTNITTVAETPATDTKSLDTPVTPAKSPDTPVPSAKTADTPITPVNTANTPGTPAKTADTSAIPAKNADTPATPAKSADTPATPAKNTDTPATPAKTADASVDNKTADKSENDGKDTKGDSKVKPDNQTPATPVKPTAVPAPDKHEVVQSRSFDGPSFIGGIILTLGLLAIGFMGFKYYKNQTERNYHTL